MSNPDERPAAQHNELLEVIPPRPGGTEIVVPHSRYFRFDKPGQGIEGLLLGKERGKDQSEGVRGQWLLLLRSGRQVVLPNHRDLDEKLEETWQAVGLGAPVWIGYRGRESVPGFSSPIARYRVQLYDTSAEDRVRAQGATSGMGQEPGKGETA